MCLDTIGKTVTLKKDKVVWKTVNIEHENSETPLFYGNINFLSSRKHTAEPPSVGTNYTQNFHCFILQRVGKIWVDSPFRKRACLEYIIPKGTKVIYGKQTIGYSQETVIVTPVLINPRVPE